VLRVSWEQSNFFLFRIAAVRSQFAEGFVHRLDASNLALYDIISLDKPAAQTHRNGSEIPTPFLDTKCLRFLGEFKAFELLSNSFRLSTTLNTLRLRSRPLDYASLGKAVGFLHCYCVKLFL
jgi:hypothetical protein